MVSRDGVNIDGVGISNRFYWTLKQHVITFYKSLPLASQSRSSLRCLVAASNSGRSSAPGLTSSQAGGHLTPTSFSSNCRLRTTSQWQLVLVIYIYPARTTQKTTPATVTPLLRVTKPLPRNGSTVLALRKYAAMHKAFRTEDPYLNTSVVQRKSVCGDSCYIHVVSLLFLSYNSQ
jgi:hypothetical protein